MPENEEKYQIFLSYSHDDAKKYGQEYIDEIKRQIEASVGEKDIVFLDAQALKPGNEWNSKIQECLNQCKVFIYLLSENYLKSEYCTRERIWWAQREMVKGRLHKATVPVFYIQIDTTDPEILRKKDNLLYLQTNKDKPWFPAGAEIVAKKFVEERLDVARIQELQKQWKNASESSSSIPSYNPKFVGRISELCSIRAICRRPGMEIESIPVIHGEAGCGKSEISFAYAHGYASEYPGGRFFIPMEHVKNWSSAWLKLGDEIDKKSGLQVYEGVLKLSKDDRKKTPEEFAQLLAQYMLAHINTKGRTLILLDNIDCMELLTDTDEGLKSLFSTEEIPDDLDIIATTRGTPILDGCSKATAVPIGNLGEEAALELLRLHCGKSPFNQDPPENDKTTAAAKELLAFLEYHAWSVEIIAGYLGRETDSGTTPEIILEKLKQKFEINKKYATFRAIPNCMETLLQPTIDKIKELELGSEILELAGAAAMFSPDAVSVKLLELLWKKRHGEKQCSHADSWLWAWKVLKDYHLISPENNGISRMHRITHEFFSSCNLSNQQELATDIKDIIDEVTTSAFSSEDVQAIYGLAVFILSQSWKDEFSGAVIYWINNILLEWNNLEGSKNLLEKLKVITTDANTPEIKAALADSWGNFYRRTCKYDKALENHKKALEIKLQSLPENHPNIASSYNNIGRVYDSMSEYTKALMNYKKALELKLQSLPKNHPNIADSYNNVGIVYDEMGEYGKALENHKKALEIKLQSLPENHPDIAGSYNNIGVTFCNMGEYDKALEYYSKALEIKLQSLPENHPDIAISYNNIGNVYDKMGEYGKALENHDKALEVKLQSLPENHPDIAISYNNIGNVCYNMGEYDKALEYHSKALEIRLNSLPENHPDFAGSYNNIGLAYDKMGEYDKALENYDKALELKLQSLPENHPDIAGSYNNIGLSYDKMGEYGKALVNFSKALEIRLNSLPENHPDIAASYNAIGCVYDRMGEYDKALVNFSKALEISLQSLPENHPAIATSYNNIGLVYEKMGEYAKALMNFSKALEILLQSLPENHPAIAASYNDIGAMYSIMGECEKALVNFSKVLEIRLNSLPENHPDFAYSYNNIGREYNKIGKYETALKYFKIAYKIYSQSLGETHPHSQLCLENIHEVDKKLRRWGWWLKIKRWFNKKKDIE